MRDQTNAYIKKIKGRVLSVRNEKCACDATDATILIPCTSIVILYLTLKVILCMVPCRLLVQDSNALQFEINKLKFKVPGCPSCGEIHLEASNILKVIYK